MNPHRQPRAPTVTIGALLIAGALHAAPDDARTLTFEEIESESIPAGELIRVSGAYVELLDDQVRLFESPVDFRVRRPAPRRGILSISADHRNLTFDAICVESAPDSTADPAEPTSEHWPVFEVIRVTAAPESRVLFATEIDRLKAQDMVGSDRLFRLAERVMKTAAHFGEPELKRLAGRAIFEAIGLETTGLDSGDVAGRLELADRAHQITADTRLTVKLLADLDERFPRNGQILRKLHSLKSRKFRGEWMTHDDFKTLQGFEKHGSVWISSREKDFLAVIYRLQTSGEQDLLVRSYTAEQYAVFASRGEVVGGMTPQEVVQALGYADRVHDREFAGKTYKQWVYADRYCYFEKNKLRRVTMRKAGT